MCCALIYCTRIFLILIFENLIIEILLPLPQFLPGCLVVKHIFCFTATVTPPSIDPDYTEWLSDVVVANEDSDKIDRICREECTSSCTAQNNVCVGEPVKG